MCFKVGECDGSTFVIFRIPCVPCGRRSVDAAVLNTMGWNAVTPGTDLIHDRRTVRICPPTRIEGEKECRLKK
jgi:hypothetical protein